MPFDHSEFKFPDVKSTVSYEIKEEILPPTPAD